MAAGDLILSSGVTLTPEDIRKIAEESKSILASESKELRQFEEVTSLSNVTSLPGIFQSGDVYKLVRVGLEVLKGLDGKSIELTKSQTAIQWRYVGSTEWYVLVELSALTGPKGNPGDPPILSTGTIETLPYGSSVTADFVLSGDSSGIPIYKINLGIPEGRPGRNGDGAGNVLVPTDNIEIGKHYVFTATTDGSAEGKLTEIESLTGVGKNYPNYINAEIFNDYENNIAAGAHAHAEGRETNATGPRSHAEGYKTRIFAADAHAEGRETWCLGAQSHVEGLYSICWGSGSHTEGAVQAEFEVEGKAILNDEESIRDFLGNYTTQYYPNGEGTEPYYWKINDSFFTSFYTHGAFGVNTHAEGINNIVCDKAGHVEGYNNIAGDMIPGHGQDSSIYAPHVEGIGNKVASLLYSVHAGGSNCTISSGNYSFVHGYNLTAKNDYEVAFGKFNASELNGQKVLFSYGIGASDTERENAISVLDDGTVIIPKLLGGGEGADLDVIQGLIDKALIPIKSEIYKNYNELNSKFAVFETKLNDIISLLQSGEGLGKAFVTGDTLVFTKLTSAEITGDTLIISDTEIIVENEVLIIK